MMALRILFCIHVSHKSSYQAAEAGLRVQNLVLGAVVLAVLIHPRFCQWTACDILWTVHLYIDAIAMVPQLWMVSKGGKINALTAHYIAATLLSNVLGLLFWYYASTAVDGFQGRQAECADSTLHCGHIVEQYAGLALLVLCLHSCGWFPREAS